MQASILLRVVVGARGHHDRLGLLLAPLRTRSCRAPWGRPTRDLAARSGAGIRRRHGRQPGDGLRQHALPGSRDLRAV